ncbi:E3 ubiquitin-protein ligase ZNF598 [Sitodiplosis mosellana]|uniref:E3 ubiquitin-protein ligase ZNF598 n=1 Tax=Sitodiplosis mosellana TaxID=263140 RepID=UPI0024450B5A|nr:E3 ubiquitin-protein ligase ZNF598 [Sitodiplosis mosellana]
MSSSDANNSTTSKSPSEESSPIVAVHASESDKTCVVCFKIVDIFSIGECDHPVCYECSTRMRVLCKQNECPICRRINQKVIFTSEILPYKELDQKNRSCLYDKQFRICFTGQRAQNAFRRLLEHTCNKCNTGAFDTAADLKDHLRKKHELFYCDICMQHLKIFSFERRAYTREQLAMHRRKGDPDNKSHRGHPLCEFCDERYLDRDELFRHLRKEHYFCHFCDADGSNHFYADHTGLRDHFNDQHFLCEEGDCKENIFSAVFRSDIDLKAHKANVHGQTSKQARTIEFQFNLAPRGRANQHQENQGAGQTVQETSTTATTTTTNPTRRIIDARNEQEFPSLGNPPINIRPTVTLNMRPSSSGLARTKENFPALGGGGSAREPFKPPSVTANASTLLFKMPAKTATANNASNKNASNKAKSAAPIKPHDFPALSVSSSKRANLESDMIETPLSFNLSAVSAKHKTLVQAYDTSSSAANMLANQKIKTIQRVETKPQAVQLDYVPSMNSKENFPALGGGASSSSSAPQWLNGTNGKQPQMSKKLKVAPAPILPTIKFNETNKKDVDSNKKAKSSEQSKPNQNDKKKDANKTENGNGKKAEKEKAKKSDDNAKKTKEKNNNGNKSEKKAMIDSSPAEQNGSGTTSNGTGVNSYSSVAHFTMPPPGFPAKKNEKSTSVPPGFESLSKDSKPKSYMSPKNALQRNQILVSHFMKSLKAPAVDEFRNLSKLFRSGLCNASAYYEHCEAVLGDRFESIFPELLALLPDINKQQELYQTYLEKHSQAKSNELHNSIQVCDRCRQVLKRGDFPEHLKLHNEIETDNKLNKNFPKLSIKK